MIEWVPLSKVTQIILTNSILQKSVRVTFSEEEINLSAVSISEEIEDFVYKVIWKEVARSWTTEKIRIEYFLPLFGAINESGIGLRIFRLTLHSR